MQYLLHNLFYSKISMTIIIDKHMSVFHETKQFRNYTLAFNCELKITKYCLTAFVTNGTVFHDYSNIWRPLFGQVAWVLGH